MESVRQVRKWSKYWGCFWCERTRVGEQKLRKVEEVEVIDTRKQEMVHEIGLMKLGAGEGYGQLENKDAGACRVGKYTAGRLRGPSPHPWQPLQTQHGTDGLTILLHQHYWWLCANPRTWVFCTEVIHTHFDSKLLCVQSVLGLDIWRHGSFLRLVQAKWLCGGDLMGSGICIGDIYFIYFVYPIGKL